MLQEGIHKATVNGEAYETKLIWGYDNFKKKFFIVGVDNAGSGYGIIEGDYDTASRVFTLNVPKLDPATGETMMYKEVRKIVSTNRQEMTMYRMDPKNNLETKALEIIYTRVK